MKGTKLASSGSSIGGLLGIFCPACIPLIGTFLTAIGLGALINFKLLSTLTIFFLTIGLMGLYMNYRIHQKPNYLIIGIIASIGIFAARYILETPIILYLSGAILAGNIIFDYKELKTCKKCEVENGQKNK